MARGGRGASAISEIPRMSSSADSGGDSTAFETRANVPAISDAERLSKFVVKL
jgi:hypothetical protein